MQRLLAAMALIALAPAARASEPLPRGAFFGARATGLAGAQIGLADDPSAAWYNPAGLAHLEHNVASLGATALQHQALHVNRLLGGPADTTIDSAFSPTSVSSLPLGAGRVALASFSPGDQGFRIDQRVQPSAQTGLVDGYSTRERTDIRYFLGGAFGYPLGPSFDVGVGVYYVYRGFREFRADSRQWSAALPDGTIALQQSSNDSGVAHGGVLVAGVLWHPGGPAGMVRVGLVARYGFDVTSRSRIEEESFVGVPDPGDPRRVIFERTSGAFGPSRLTAAPGPALGAGFSLRIAPALTLAADAMLLGFSSDPAGLVATRPALNGAAGLEVQLHPKFRMQAGLFANHAALREQQAALRPDLWDEYGLGLGGTYYGASGTAGAALRGGLIHGRGTLTLIGSDAPERIAASGYEVSVVFGGSYYL